MLSNHTEKGKYPTLSNHDVYINTYIKVPWYCDKTKDYHFKRHISLIHSKIMVKTWPRGQKDKQTMVSSTFTANCFCEHFSVATATREAAPRPRTSVPRVYLSRNIYRNNLYHMLHLNGVSP